MSIFGRKVPGENQLTLIGHRAQSARSDEVNLCQPGLILVKLVRFSLPLRVTETTNWLQRWDFCLMSSILICMFLCTSSLDTIAVHSGMFLKVVSLWKQRPTRWFCKFLTFSHTNSVFFSTQLTLFRPKNSIGLKEDWIHVRKCQKFAKSSYRPRFCILVKTSADNVIL